MTQVKKAMKKPPYFDDISLDPTIYLRWVQTLEDYSKVKWCLDEKRFKITI